MIWFDIFTTKSILIIYIYGVLWRVAPPHLANVSDILCTRTQFFVHPHVRWVQWTMYAEGEKIQNHITSILILFWYLTYFTTASELGLQILQIPRCTDKKRILLVYLFWLTMHKRLLFLTIFYHLFISSLFTAIPSYYILQIIQETYLKAPSGLMQYFHK